MTIIYIKETSITFFLVQCFAVCFLIVVVFKKKKIQGLDNETETPGFTTQ